MKTKFLVAAALAAVMATTGAAQAADATGDASATIATPISVSQATALNFGTVFGSASAGTVVISTTGSRSVTGGVTEFGGTVAAGAFNVTGEGTSAYSISLPADNAASLTGSGDPMLLTGFGHDAGGSPALTGGSDSFNVGATLNVNASQVTGSYTGTYTVTVNYN